MSPTRAVTAELAKTLADSDAPVYVLDEERVIVFCNAACAGLFGLKAAELVGEQCVYDTPDGATPATLAAAALCPPPKVFSGKMAAAVVACGTPGGVVVYRRGQFLPLTDSDERSQVMAVLETRDCPANSAAQVLAEDGTLHDEVRRFRQQMAGRYEPARWIGHSPAITRARAQIELAANTRAAVLIVGPSGTGKTHAAKTIHYAQADPAALVPLDGAVLETNVLRSALRSLWAKNAAQKLAHGTLLVTDLDCLAAEAQADLAEILRSGLFRMRVIAASTRPVGELAARGEFLPELAALVSTITIELPPLSTRKEDLPLLAQALVENINAGGAKQVGGLSAEALDRLTAYTWPGNINELESMLRESHERAAGGEIGAKDLPYRIQSNIDAVAHPKRVDEAIVLEEFMARVERELIERAMRRAKGNKTKAARLLGLSRPRLYRRLIQLGLELPPEGPTFIPADP